jgi:hypothetical protein
MLTYPIRTDAKEKELNIVHEILHNNEYNKNFKHKAAKSTKNKMGHFHI